MRNHSSFHHFLDKCISVHYTENQDALKNGGKTIFGKKLHESQNTLWSKTLSKLLYLALFPR